MKKIKETPKTELIKSTKLLGRLLDLSLSPLEKIDIISQIFDNLTVLKSEMTIIQYNKSFKNIEQRIKRIINRLTDPEFIEKLLKKINEIK